QAEAVDAVREAVSAAVTRRMVADVPLGALLSGGIDSSIVCALMCRAAGDPAAVRTFSAGFAEGRFDERPYARRVAEHLGTRHAEVLIEPDAASIVDDLVRQYDEPFGDSSSLSTYLLCRQVREAVTVALVGDGGDEAFAGYDRHRAMWLTQHMSCIKGTLITAGGVLLDSFAPRDEKHPLRRFVRFARGMDAPAALRYLSYRQLLSLAELDDLLTDDLAEQINPATGRDWFTHLYEHDCGDSEMRNAQRHDVLTYLPDDLLVKADIASMAWGLELRSPFLDHHVIELGLALPDEFKVDRHRGKRILAAAFGDLLPAEVFDRPKAGFGVPIDTWLRGPLLPTLKETLLDQSFIDTGWLRRTAIERMIDRHVTGKADHRHPLWALLCLGRWYALQESRHSE
ncbi:MAG: asparagine synthetase B, partial [Hyphomicrobiales bacterium]